MEPLLGGVDHVQPNLVMTELRGEPGFGKEVFVVVALEVDDGQVGVSRGQGRIGGFELLEQCEGLALVA